MKALAWLWGKFKALLKFILGVVWGGIKKYFIEPGIKIALVRVGGAVFGSLGMWFAAILFGPPQVSQALNPTYIGKDYSVEFRQLKDDLFQAREDVKSDRSKRDQERQADKIEQANLRAEIKRLLAQGGEILSVTKGKGTAQVQGGGKVMDGHYEDAWLTADIAPDTSMQIGFYHLGYEFNFELKDASVEVREENGREIELYSASIISTRDPAQEIFLQNYGREREVNVITPPEMARFFWGDWSLSVDYVFGGGFMGGLSVSPFTFTEGGLAPEKVILRFPDMGLATDFSDRLFLAVGARYNLGRHLPLLSDLFIAPKLGYGQGGFSFLLGIGTTL